MKTVMFQIRIYLLSVIGMVILSTLSFAWPGTDNGVAICTASNNQYNQMLVSDGQGGAIIGWYDYRNGNYDIYSQAIDSTGAVKWTADGVAICTVSGSQGGPRMISDNAGGAIMAWHDTRSGASNYDIYAQSVNSNGSTLWTLNGISISTVVGSNQIDPRITSNNVGGGIIVWRDTRNGSGNDDIYAQSIDSTGTVKWTDNGVAVCNATKGQWAPQIVSDNQGGAIITWYDYRNSSSTTDIYTQAIDSTGAVKWTTDGVAVCSASGEQLNPQIISDGKGGAIITWQDTRNGNNDIYAQAIDNTGTAKWAANGVAICTSANPQLYPQLVSDGNSGAVIAWQSNGSDIYAQAIDSTGATKWAANGVVICSSSIDGTDVNNPRIVTDGNGGAIIAWSDVRNGAEEDIYAQAISSAGVTQWKNNGTVITEAASYQWGTQMIADGKFGAIIAWTDTRNDSVSYTGDIYVQNISTDGIVPVTLSFFDIE
jgi:hypothetical protein